MLALITMIIKSRTSVRDLLYFLLVATSSFAREKKKSRRNTLKFFLGAFQQISRTFFFGGVFFKFLFYFVLFFFPWSGEKICVSHYAKTVKGRKILKTDLDSCHSEALQDYEFDDVAWAICSQEHLPSFLFFGHYAKTV